MGILEWLTKLEDGLWIGVDVGKFGVERAVVVAWLRLGRRVLFAEWVADWPS